MPVLMKLQNFNTSANHYLPLLKSIHAWM